MSRQELIDKLPGTGPVYDESGERVGEARYMLWVYQEMKSAGTLQDPDAELPGLKDIRGRVEGLDTFDLLGKTLTLHLEDGRHLDFLIENSGGDIAGSGDFYNLPED